MSAPPKSLDVSTAALISHKTLLAAVDEALSWLEQHASATAEQFAHRKALVEEVFKGYVAAGTAAHAFTAVLADAKVSIDTTKSNKSLISRDALVAEIGRAEGWMPILREAKAAEMGYSLRRLGT